MIFHNDDDVVMRLREKIEGFADLQDLGDDLTEIIGGGMHDRCTRTTAPDGTPWARNAPGTIARKGFDDPGTDTGEMLDRSNFTSQYQLQDAGYTLYYSGPADRLRWFEGDNRYGVARPAWGLDPFIVPDVDERLRQYFRERLHGRR
jgi:hypothetical protein